MARYLLDTDTLIDYSNGHAPTVALVKGLYQDGHRLGVCCINITEFYSGLAEIDRDKARRFLDAMEYFEVSREAARRAGEYRYLYAVKGIQLSATDAITAAIAVEHGATLVTGNASHYPMEEVSLLRLPM